MDYQKPATTIDAQIALLQQRGLACKDEDLVRRWLITVGYYRLSAYWLPFEKAPASGQTRSKVFADGTEFETIIQIYTFDRRLRLLVSEAIERIEIALRSSWTHRLSIAHGSHAHMDARHFKNGWRHAQQLSALAGRVESSNEVFVDHYRAKYDQPYMPPLWVVTELLTFGELSKWVAATADPKIGAGVARDLGLPTRETLEGAIQAIAYVRNICAHHGRLWNRRLVKRIPNIKRFGADLSVDINGDQAQPENYIYNLLVVLCRMLLAQSPDTSFPSRLKNLVSERSAPQTQAMGFPIDWMDRPLWKLAGE